MKAGGFTLVLDKSYPLGTQDMQAVVKDAIATDADSYAITFPPEADAVTRRLMLAAALSVDLTMKQKDYSLDL